MTDNSFVAKENNKKEMKTPRRRDGGVSIGRFINSANPPLPPFSKVGLEVTPQQRLWGIENLIKILNAKMKEKVPICSLARNFKRVL